MKSLFSSQFSVLRFLWLALFLSALSTPLSAQNVGDRIIRERIATTGQEAIRYWPKGSLKLWGDNASQLPASIAIGTGLTLSGSPLTLSASAGGAQDAFILNDEAGDTLTSLESGLGWRDSRLTIQGVPGGALQMYETGDPLEGVLYWAGRIQVGSLEAAEITGEISADLITSGSMASAIFRSSTPQPLRAFHDGASYAGAYGLTYGATGPNSSIEPSTPGTYFPEILVVDGDPDANYLQGRIRTATQLRSDLGLGTLATVTPTGTTTGSKFLRDDYTWQTASGSSGLTIASTTITSGTSGRILKNTSGVLDEVATTGSGSVVLATSPSISGPWKDSNGNNLLGITATASAVNYPAITNAATGGTVILEALGTDTHITMQIKEKGSSGSLKLGRATNPIWLADTGTTVEVLRMFYGNANGVTLGYGLSGGNGVALGYAASVFWTTSHSEAGSTSAKLYTPATNRLQLDSADLAIGTVGKGIRITEGTNATSGVATLVGGTVTVSTTSVTTDSRIQLTVQSLGTVTAPKAVAVTARTAATSFVITSADATDTSVVAWLIIKPN